MENKKDDCVYPSDFASQIGLAGKVDDLVKMGFNIECKFINLGYIMDMNVPVFTLKQVFLLWKKF